MKNKQLPATTADQRNALIAKDQALLSQLNSAKKADQAAVEQLRQAAVQTPGILSASSTTDSVRLQLLEKISHGASRAIMLAEVDALKKQLNYDAAPPLERLLIDHILRRTPFFRPLSAENKMDSRGLLSWLLLLVSRSLCALNPLGKERTSRAGHYPSSLSRLMGFPYLPPKAV